MGGYALSKRSLLRALASALALAVTARLTACADRERAAEPGEPIVIGVIAPVTSSFLRSGPPTVQGATLAAKHINADGGVAVAGARRPIRLVVEDTEDQPETAVSKAFKLIGSEGAAALVGLPISDSAVAVARVAEQHRVPMITTTATHPEITRGKHFIFRVIFNDSYQGRVLARFAYDDLEVRRASVFFDPSSAYSRDLAEMFRQYFEQHGGEITAYEGFIPEDAAGSERLAQGCSETDAILLPMYPALLGSIMDQVRGIDDTLPALGGDSWGLLEDSERTGWSPAYFTDVWAPSGSAADSSRFAEAFEKEYGALPTSYAALAYDAVFLIARAMEFHGDAAPESIQAGLRSLSDFAGITGTIRFEGGGDPVRSAVIVRLAPDGTAHLHRRLEP